MKKVKEVKEEKVSLSIMDRLEGEIEELKKLGVYCLKHGHYFEMDSLEREELHNIYRWGLDEIESRITKKCKHCGIVMSLEWVEVKI